MGPQLEYLETVLTCKGNFYAPDFSSHLDDLKCRLQELVFSNDNNKLVVKKVEPWNSVRVTLKMPVDAAHKLKRLAEQRDKMLHEIGILEVQIEGDRVISLAIDGSKSDALNQSLENKRKTENVADTSCCSGNSVPSKDILIPFASLPQSSSCLEWPLFTKVLHSLDDRPSSSLRASVPHSSVDCRVLPTRGLPTGPTSCGSLNVAASYLDANNSAEFCNFIQNASSPPVELNSQPAGRAWIVGDDKPISCQNIASSSPLLVNLLKSPGNRTQLNCSLSIQAHPSCNLSSDTTVPAQKRKRNQSRKSKRLKEGVEGTSALIQSSDWGIPGSFTTFQCCTANTPSTNALNDVTFTNISESRQIINPYTGDLEVIDESDELPSASPIKEVVHSVTSKSKTSFACDVDGLEKVLSSQSSGTLTSFHNGATRLSSPSNSPTEGLLRLNPQTSKSGCSGANILSSRANSVHSIACNRNQQNLNLTLPHSSSSIGFTENSQLLLNHALSSGYMQSMLKVLSSENTTKLFASQQPLVLSSSFEQNQEAAKPIIDASCLAKLIVQSPLLPKSLSSLRNVGPLSLDAKAFPHQSCSALFNSNGQLPQQQFFGNSKFPPVRPGDVKSPHFNILPLMEGQTLPIKARGSQNQQKLGTEMDTEPNNVASSQPTQLMKEIFSNLNVPARISVPSTCALYNGHFEDQDLRTSQTESPKSASSCPPDFRMANGCYGLPATPESVSGLSEIVKNIVSCVGTPSLLSAGNVDTSFSLDCDSGSSDTKSSSILSALTSKPLPPRKSLKNAEDTLPAKSKANLTVAQLLEQVEIAKNHLAFASSATQKSCLSEVSLAYSTSTYAARLCSDSEMTLLASRNLSTLHTSQSNNKLPPHSNSANFNILDSLRMPITSPGYPDNLTESVQKAMRGIGFESSPSSSPTPRSTSNRTESLEHRRAVVKAKAPIERDAPKSYVPVNNITKQDSSAYANYDILENHFELGRLELFKSCLKDQELGNSLDQTITDGQKNLIDLDGSDLDFVFNVDDESIIKDYDAIEKLAETLASNMDDGDIDEDILMTDHDLGLLAEGSESSGASKNEYLIPSDVKAASSTNINTPTERGQQSLLNIFQRRCDRASKIDNAPSELENKDARVERVVNNVEVNIVDSENSGEKIKCKNINTLKGMPADTGGGAGLEKNEDFCDEAALQFASNRMATRSSNKRCPPAAGSLSGHQTESTCDPQGSIPPSPAHPIKPKPPEEIVTPLLRRSNRTVRKTELAVESLQAKAKRTKDEGVVDDKCHPAPSAKSEQSTRTCKQKCPQKRKYNHKGGNNVNENNIRATIDDPNNEQPSTRKAGNVPSSPVPLEPTMLEADFVLCNKRPRTS